MEHRKNNSEVDDLQEAVEDRLLRVNARVIDGSTRKVFSVLPTERGPQWRCHACQITVMGSREIYKHERSNDHARVMVETKAHPIENFREQSIPPPPHQTLLEMSLAPGEPVPPGFEGEVRGIAEIQKKLDAFNSSPLIGLEYLFELHSYDDKEPHYICILCDKRGDPRTVMAHLNSFNHRMKFIESHFPKVNQKIQKYRASKEYKRVCQTLITTVSEWIEKRFGRLVPHACDKDSFERKRESYTQIVVKDVHFSDKYGETLEEFVHENLFDSPDDNSGAHSKSETSLSQPVPGCKPPEVIKRRSPSPPIVNAPGKNKQQLRGNLNRNTNRRSDKSPLSSVSSLSFSGDSSPERSSKFDQVSSSSTRRPREPYRKYEVRRSRSRSSSYSRMRARRYKYRSRSISKSPPPGAKTRYLSGRFPWKRNDYVQIREKTDSSVRKKISAETARWEEFKKGILKIEDELEHTLRNHEKNPEKHPQYPEEWKKFWNRRYKELQAEHKDPSKHDFKPEWIDFWNKRMKEMHETELKSRKDALRKRLNLPEEPQPIKFKIGNKKSAIQKDDIPSSSLDDVIVIDDAKDDDIKPRARRTISKERRDRKRSHSPWEPDYLYELERYPPKRDYYSGQRIMGSDMRSKKYISHSLLEKKPMMEEPEDDDAQLNIVAVLRLLTALEEKLGSLGPKVIDMLSTALAMEKTEANSAETLLDNDVHCVLFETVKEKLKGQLLAGMIEPQAEKPAKNAVKRIASLLHISSERKRKREEEIKRLNAKPKPLSVPGIGEVDKEAIAKQITAALLTQGRTNVTQDELEQLIGAVVGMAQARSTGQTVTTAEYVDKMKHSTEPEKKTITPSTSSTSSALLTLQSSYGADSSAMDGLSDSDLKTLLQNFKDLSTDEQHGLISYLKKLEAHEPERVERLRKFVNLEPSKTSETKEEKRELLSTPPPQQKPQQTAMSSSSSSQQQRAISPFSKRSNDVVDITSPKNKTDLTDKFDQNSNNSGFVKIDSDEDDDYTYEDVFKAASKNLKDKQLEEEKIQRETTSAMETTNNPIDPNAVLKDAKLMIANIMGQLGQKNAISSAASNNTTSVMNPVTVDMPKVTSNILIREATAHLIDRPIIPGNSLFRDNYDNRSGGRNELSNNQFPPFSQNFDNSQYSNYSNFNNYNNPNSIPFQRPPNNINPNFQGPPQFKSNPYEHQQQPPPFNNGNSGNHPFNSHPYDQFGIPSQQSAGGGGGSYSNSNQQSYVDGGPPGIGGFMDQGPPPSQQQQQQGNYSNTNSYNFNNGPPPSYNNRGFY